MTKPKLEKDGSVKLTKQTTEWLKEKFLEHHHEIDQAESNNGLISGNDYRMAAAIEDELLRRGIQVEITERKVCDYKFIKGRKT